MKVVVIQGSPKMDKGNTHLILEPFMNGMKKEGAEIDLVYIEKLSLKRCRGDFNCMFKTPGRCFINDDMQILYPKLVEADIWVFAVPVYWCGFPSGVRNLIERLMPFLQPVFEIYKGNLGHPWRENIKVSRIALVATSGTPELFNFDSMVAELKGICNKCGKNGILSTKFTGSLLRPDAQRLRNLVYHDIIDAAFSGGRELIMDGYISDTVQQTVSRPLSTLPLLEIVEEKNSGINEKLDIICRR